MLLSRMSRVVPLLAVVTACTRHPVVPEDERRPKVLESQWELCGNGVHDPVFPCGGPFDIPEPNSPDSPNTISCAPSPVARGDTVTCTIELPKWQVPYATSDPDSVFKAVVILADTNGRFNESPGDSIYVIDIAYEDGAASTTSNVWKWQLKGPAVTDSKFGVQMYAADTLGMVHIVTGSTAFAIGSFGVSPAVSLGGSVSSTTAWGNTLMRDDGMGLNGRGEREVNWGRTLSPLLDDGLEDDSAWTARGIGWTVPYDTAHFTLPLVGSGPNKGLRYLATPLALGPVMSIYSRTILGQGPWADRQLGFGLGSPTPAYCDKMLNPGIFGLLANYVRKHEGSVSGADSHFDIFKEVVNGNSYQEFVVQTQRRWFRTWGDHPIVTVREMLTQRLEILGSEAHDNLDDELEAEQSDIADCTWVP